MLPDDNSRLNTFRILSTSCFVLTVSPCHLDTSHPQRDTMWSQAKEFEIHDGLFTDVNGNYNHTVHTTHQYINVYGTATSERRRALDEDRTLQCNIQ